MTATLPSPELTNMDRPSGAQAESVVHAAHALRRHTTGWLGSVGDQTEQHASWLVRVHSHEASPSDGPCKTEPSTSSDEHTNGHWRQGGDKHEAPSPLSLNYPLYLE